MRVHANSSWRVAQFSVVLMLFVCTCITVYLCAPDDDNVLTDIAVSSHETSFPSAATPTQAHNFPKLTPVSNCRNIQTPSFDRILPDESVSLLHASAPSPSSGSHRLYTSSSSRTKTYQTLAAQTPQYSAHTASNQEESSYTPVVIVPYTPRYTMPLAVAAVKDGVTTFDQGSVADAASSSRRGMIAGSGLRPGYDPLDPFKTPLDGELCMIIFVIIFCFTKKCLTLQGEIK